MRLTVTWGAAEGLAPKQVEARFSDGSWIRATRDRGARLNIQTLKFTGTVELASSYARQSLVRFDKSTAFALGRYAERIVGHPIAVVVLAGPLDGSALVERPSTTLAVRPSTAVSWAEALELEPDTPAAVVFWARSVAAPASDPVAMPRASRPMYMLPAITNGDLDLTLYYAGVLTLRTTTNSSLGLYTEAIAIQARWLTAVEPGPQIEWPVDEIPEFGMYVGGPGFSLKMAQAAFAVAHGCGDVGIPPWALVSLIRATLDLAGTLLVRGTGDRVENSAAWAALKAYRRYWACYPPAARYSLTMALPHMMIGLLAMAQGTMAQFGQLTRALHAVQSRVFGFYGGRSDGRSETSEYNFFRFAYRFATAAPMSGGEASILSLGDWILAHREEVAGADPRALGRVMLPSIAGIRSHHDELRHQPEAWSAGALQFGQNLGTMIIGLLTKHDFASLDWVDLQ